MARLIYGFSTNGLSTKIYEFRILAYLLEINSCKSLHLLSISLSSFSSSSSSSLHCDAESDVNTRNLTSFSDPSNIGSFYEIQEHHLALNVLLLEFLFPFCQTHTCDALKCVFYLCGGEQIMGIPINEESKKR